MKVLVFGANGMLGTVLCSVLKTSGHSVIASTRTDFDIITGDLPAYLQKNPSDVIVNCAAIISQRAEGVDRAGVVAVNARFPHLLRQYAEQTPLIHISTDSVFSGKTGLHTEDHEPDPAGFYSLTKLLGEPRSACVIRTAIVGEGNPVSLLGWMQRNAGKTVEGYADHLWNGMTTFALSRIITSIITEKAEWVGVRHLYASDVSKCELLEMINEAYELGCTIKRTHKGGIDRRLRTIFPENQRYATPPIRTQLNELRAFHRINNL